MPTLTGASLRGMARNAHRLLHPIIIRMARGSVDHGAYIGLSKDRIRNHHAG
jgi:hypothetical protein